MSVNGSASLTRRQYPREVDGAKNEWKALVDHFTEAGRQSTETEKNYYRAKADLQKMSTSK
jgi:hypothetical protein